MEKLFTFILSMLTAREDEDRGATMVEYGIMVAGIAVVVMAVVLVLGGEIAALFQQIVDAI